MSGTVGFTISDHKINEIMKTTNSKNNGIYGTCQKEL
jgi:hypothetical protein